MDSQVVEVVTFRLKPGIDPLAFQQAIAGSQRFLDTQPGYRSRELFRDSRAGDWLDLVRWESLAAAEAAANCFPASKDCAPLFAMIDEASVSLRHLQAEARWGDTQ